MDAVFVLLAFVAFGIAFVLYQSAFRMVEPTFPPQFQNNNSSYYAIDVYVWNSNVPARARRYYMLSSFLGCVMIALMAAGIFSAGDVGVASLFAALATFLTVFTARRWIKYRELL